MNKNPGTKVARHTCKSPQQDALHGQGMRVWNARVLPKGLKFVGWACTVCGEKISA